ncbi:hypothetical protein Ancab_024407, partial [Ancistrocladus abbreviatus]
ADIYEKRITTMRPSPILRCLSSYLLLPRQYTSPVVAPLPEHSLFNQQIAPKLDNLLKALECTYTTSSCLVAALDASIETTQKLAQRLLVDVNVSGSNAKFIDDYLDEDVELLDACNGLLEKMEMIRKMADSSRIITHLLERGPNHVALTRVKELLDRREFAYLGKCRSNLRRLNFSQCCKNGFGESDGLGEMLSGSKAVAFVACHFLEMALSFKSKRGLTDMKSFRATTEWSSSLLVLQKVVKEEAQKHQNEKQGSYHVMLAELGDMIMALGRLRDQVNRYDGHDHDHECKLRVSVEVLKDKCNGLEKGIEQVEGRVKKLSRELISIRMALLGILSHQ